mmetsp:Transcript_2916/g.6376  ORF Transcript_2916/g.6376 Transcript_2916/m.6376 type:complete len:835 (-) Transcript_2916:499-3003(-)
MANMWRNHLESLKSAVQEGVKEFSQAAIEGVRDIQTHGVRHAIHEMDADGKEPESGATAFPSDPLNSIAHKSVAEAQAKKSPRAGVAGHKTNDSLHMDGSPALPLSSAAMSSPKPSANDLTKTAAGQSRDSVRRNIEQSTTPDQLNRGRDHQAVSPSAAGGDADDAVAKDRIAPPAHTSATTRMDDGLLPEGPASQDSQELPTSALISQEPLMNNGSTTAPIPLAGSSGSRRASSSSLSQEDVYAFNSRSRGTETRKGKASDSATEHPPLPSRSSGQAAAPTSSSAPLVTATALRGAATHDEDQHGGGAGGASGSHGGGSEDMRRAYNDMKKAYDDMKGLLKKSMDECMRLSEEVVRLEQAARQAQSTAADQAAAAKAAKKEAADAGVALAQAKKDAAAAEKALAKAQAALDSKVSSEASNAELDALHTELAAAVRQASAAVQAKEAAEVQAQLAEKARQEAEAARNEADRLRREAQAEAHAAIAAAEAERNVRAEAEGLSESLKADSERRARVFNNAVKAAVGKVQRELEAERDELQSHLREMQRLLADTKMELKRALASAEDAAAEAAARTADAEAAGHVAVAAEQAAERARQREQEAVAAAHAAESARQKALNEADSLRLECSTARAGAEVANAEVSALRAELEATRGTYADRCSELEREMSRQAERADIAANALITAEKQLAQATVQGRDSITKAEADAAAARKRVEELEAEVQQLRASSNVMSRLFQLPTKQDVLAGLGLELWKDDRLRWKQEDVEASPQVQPRPRPRDKGVPGTEAKSQRTLGHVSLRVWLIVGYLSLLHIAVMVGFTRTHDVCDKLPGMASHDMILP